MPKPIKWTLDNIRQGLDQYQRTHDGRYPSALEIDKFDLLPSSRQIQRKFGGLIKLREVLGLLNLDYTKGEIRSDLARKTWKRGIDSEKFIYELLLAKFGEIFVHAQKPFPNYKGRFDYFVYTERYKFGVDVFFADESHSFAGCVNTKQRVYRNISSDIILLSMNELFCQSLIDEFVKNKTNQLAGNIKVLTLESFKTFISKLEPIKLN